jgi:hypothetical protein
MSNGKAKGTGDPVRSRLAELNFARNIKRLLLSGMVRRRILNSDVVICLNGLDLTAVQKDKLLEDRLLFAAHIVELNAKPDPMMNINNGTIEGFGAVVRQEKL